VLLSGRDVQAGGTWLGINKSTGRVALTTNITEPAGATYASSRGTLAASFLADPNGDSGLARAVAALTSQDPDATTTRTRTTAAAASTTTSYAGFNLLLLEPSVPPGTTTTGDAGTELTYDARLLTNGGGGGRVRARTLSDAERASGGISNGVDGEGGDAWPKVVQGRATLRSVLVEHRREVEVEVDKDQDQVGEGPSSSSGGPDREIADDAADVHLAERLIELLTAHSPNPPPRVRAETRNAICVPPLNDANNEPGAPLAYYGTRLAQVILVRRDGRVTFIERDVWTLDGAGTPVRASAADMRSFVFRLGSNP